MSELLKSLLIRAGAGTGKTETLIKSVYEIFHKFTLLNDREPRLIVCTFTRKASQELKERLLKLALKEIESFSQESDLQKAPAFLNYLQSSFLQVSTIDGILNRFLKKYGSVIGLNPDFEISYSASNEELFDSLAEKFIYDKYFSLLQKFPYPVLKDIFLSYFKNRLKYGNISFYDKDDFEDFKQEKNMISSLIESKSSFDSFFKENSELQFLDSEKIKKWAQQDESFCSEEFMPVFEKLKEAGEDFFSIFLEKKKTSSILDVEDLLLFSHHLLQQQPCIANTFSKEWDYWFIDEYQDTSWLQEQIIEQLTKFENVICVGDPGQSIYAFRGADPQVFSRREKNIKESITQLEINYRSSAQLIGFYNDFFNKETFIKFKISVDKKRLSSVKPYLSFFTYNKQEEECQKIVFQTLYHYIQKLRNQGVDYGRIAVLSSKNEDIFKTANYLRSKKLPAILYSSNNFSQNRLVLDSVFLLKFLINPYDDVNLKALLRSPYFKLVDQDLADSSYQYNSNKKNFLSFWSFIKEKYKESLFVKQLKSFLDNYKKLGLFESFKQALFDSALMDLSYWQDPTSSSTANLWKLLD
ncbi:MAG: UvrD-helicase domain-containing protein, partial [Oligoflexia bacterium]|nr:UvrD-helicase domain-containing protein [Oligoflexia bacterium]